MYVSNIWGCIFSFLIPGIVIGILIALTAVEVLEASKARRRRSRKVGTATKNRD